MSELKQTPAIKQKMHTSSQSSDDFLQQFPAPPVPHHCFDSDERVRYLDNGHHQMNGKTHIGSNPPAFYNNSALTSSTVQKPDDIHNNTLQYRSNNAPALISNATQVQYNLPDACALNTDFKIVDRPEKKTHWTKRNCFFRWVCCSMCFPPWVAYILWFIVIAVIICLIVIGAILGSFKIPTIEFAGLNSTLPSGTPQIQFSSVGIVINAGLILNVINPNILNLKLSNLTAKAYYPINGTMVQIGKGYLDYQFIPKKSNINFTYPFEIDYSPNDPDSKYLLANISDKCGNTPSDIDVSYDVSLNVQVLFVQTSPTISSIASFACPFQDGQIPGLSPSGSSDGAILGGLGAQVNDTTATSQYSPSTVESTSTTSSIPLSFIPKSFTIRTSTSTLVIPTSVITPLSGFQSRIMFTSSQHSISNLPPVHSSPITSISVKPSTTIKSSAPRPTPSSQSNNDENDDDDNEYDDNYQV